MEKTFSENYRENKKLLSDLFGIGTNYDFVCHEQKIAEHEASFYFIDSFVKSDILERLFIYLAGLNEVTAEKAAEFIKAHLPYTEVTVEKDIDKFICAVMSGTAGMIMDSFGDVGIIIDVRLYPTRSIAQSDNDRILRGSHDSFVETVKHNTTLIRRRIRDTNLRFERFSVGSASKSDIIVSYIEGKADSEYLESLKNKINSINIEALSLGQQSLAECLIKQGWYNPFPKFRYTERPDAAAAHLLEGSIIIICDTSPEAMILPTCLLDFMQETDDYYFPPLTGSFMRLLRFAVFLSAFILIPTWYLLIANPELAPDWIGFAVKASPHNLPIILQLFIGEFTLDALRLASANTPSSLNNTFGVVGGLILGDFAVQIGWFVPEVILYLAITAIAGFSQSSYELGYTAKFMRIFLLGMTFIGGLTGYVSGLVLIIVFAAANKTVNGKRNYLYPLIPFDFKALKRLITREQLK